MGSSKKKALLEGGAAFAVRLADGRYGVCRVLGQAHGNDVRSLGGPAVLVACSAWIGQEIPDAADPALRPILLRTHHSWSGEPEVFWADDPPPKSFIPLGEILPSAEERKIKSGTFAAWESCELSPLMQWRWDHDRAAVLAEDALEEEAEAREMQKRLQDSKKHLKSVTFKKLSTHVFFRNWTGFVATEALRASRKLMKTTLNDLVALGKKAPEAERKLVLQRCIEGFNTLDKSMGHFIETSERDDICTEFELLLHACGLGDHENLADEWRDW